MLPGWDWAVIMSGLEGAVSRYDDGLGTQNGILARVAVGEALWWTAAADEFIRKRVSNTMALSAYLPEGTGDASHARPPIAVNPENTQLTRPRSRAA
jgi:hypothetical protein